MLVCWLTCRQQQVSWYGHGERAENAKSAMAQCLPCRSTLVTSAACLCCREESIRQQISSTDDCVARRQQHPRPEGICHLVLYYRSRPVTCVFYYRSKPVTGLRQGVLESKMQQQQLIPTKSNDARALLHPAITCCCCCACCASVRSHLTSFLTSATEAAVAVAAAAVSEQCTHRGAASKAIGTPDISTLKQQQDRPVGQIRNDNQLEEPLRVESLTCIANMASGAFWPSP
jgi:hypothetical protein